MRSLLPLLVTLLLCTSCQYEWVDTSEATIAVPYAKEDMMGGLTKSVVSALGKKGVIVNRTEGEFLLSMTYRGSRSEVTGLTYNLNEEGQKTGDLVSNEAREIVTVSVQLLDNHTKAVLAGPQEFEAASEFDFEISEVDVNHVQFSVSEMNIRSESSQVATQIAKESVSVQIADWVQFKINELNTLRI